MKSWIWPLLLVLTVFLASGTTTVAGPDIINLDKLVHFLVFGLIAVLVLRCRLPVTWRWSILVIIMVSTYGALDEIRQSFTPGRSVEWQDWLADTLGAMISVLLYKTVPLYPSILELKFKSKSGQDGSIQNNGHL